MGREKIAKMRNIQESPENLNAGIGVTGRSKKKMKKIMQELYLYYGVSGEDIRNKTERYMSLLAVLSSR